LAPLGRRRGLFLSALFFVGYGGVSRFDNRRSSAAAERAPSPTFPG